MSAIPPGSSEAPGRRPPAARGRNADDAIVVGLVNCMSEAAQRATERQFRGLLDATPLARRVALRLLPLPGAASGHADDPWDDADEFDGVIVTGVEPRAATLPEEPCWPALTRIADWAERAAVPTIWSCLAAHAAVRHISGIERRRRRRKLSGVFECVRATEHPLLAGMPFRWRVPHSRCNELDDAALLAWNYRVLSRSTEAGADMFIREGRSLALFLQGHPEYEPQTLLLEYRRDVGRFLAGQRDRYPDMPEHYFDHGAGAALAAFRERALRMRRPEALEDFPVSVATAAFVHSWRVPAIRLYSNWLSILAAQRCRRLSRTLRQSAAAPWAEPTLAHGDP